MYHIDVSQKQVDILISKYQALKTDITPYSTYKQTYLSRIHRISNN